MKHLLPLIAVIALTTGCTNFYWPQHGHSGVAEERPHMVHWHYTRHQLEHMEQEMAEARRDMHFLRHHGLEKHHPAIMHDINMYLIGMEREFEGHYYRDAEVNLRTLQHLLREAYRDMHHHPLP